MFITMSSCSGLVTTFMYSSSRVVHSCTITNLVTEKKNCLQANPTLKSYMVKFGHHMGETILFFNVGQFCIVLNNDDPLKEDIFLTTIYSLYFNHYGKYISLHIATYSLICSPVGQGLLWVPVQSSAFFHDH